MVSMGLRDTLNRHGIPKDWLEVDPLVVRGPRGDVHCYVRLRMKRWEPRLLAYASAFEGSLMKRIALLDPTSSSWLRGFSWQFTPPPLPDVAYMPPPSTWLAQEANAEVGAKATVDPRAAAEEKVGELLAAGDSRFGRLIRSKRERVDFEPTQPFLAPD